MTQADPRDGFPKDWLDVDAMALTNGDLDEPSWPVSSTLIEPRIIACGGCGEPTSRALCHACANPSTPIEANPAVTYTQYPSAPLLTRNQQRNQRRKDAKRYAAYRQEMSKKPNRWTRGELKRAKVYAHRWDDLLNA